MSVTTHKQPGYLAVFEGDDDSGWSAYFPDVSGCVSTGATYEECAHNMAEALAFHLDGLREDGLPLPEASGIRGSMILA